MKKKHGIICYLNLALFIGSLLLFAFTWFHTSSSIVRTFDREARLSASHTTGMAGSLAQISEKTEYESDLDNELSAAAFAVCLSFLLSSFADACSTLPGIKDLTFRVTASQPIFRLTRNFRI